MRIDKDLVSQAVRAQSSDPHVRLMAMSMFEGWLKKYGSADATYKILHVEPEFLYALDNDTILLGRLDLVAQRGDGELFFGDWKTGSQSKKKFGWVHDWIMSHQALTYGLLTKHGAIVTKHQESRTANLQSLGALISKFHVRYAFKPPSLISGISDSNFECEWFTFSDAEIGFWRNQVLDIAADIRRLRHQNGLGSGYSKPWSPNFNECHRYGKDYQCDYFKQCSQLHFSFAEDDAQTYQQRLSHLTTEQNLFAWGLAQPSHNLVVLDSSRISEFMGCREKYKKRYEINLVPVTGTGKRETALDIGIAFHAALENYYKQLQTTL